MGNNLSKITATERQPRVVLDGNKVVHLVAGSQGVSPEIGTQACHVEVHNWRSPDRTFHLEDSVENPQDGFDDRLDWIDDTLHFTLQVPPSYPGGVIKLVQRVQQLLAGEPLLGIAARHVGRHAIRMAGEARGRPGKAHKWNKSSNLHGCACKFLRRVATATTTEFKFVVQEDEAAIIVVDHNDEEYKEVVGDRPSTFLSIMALPIRVWLRTLQWCKTYERVHKASNAQIDAIVDAARRAAAERAVSDAAVTAAEKDKEDWRQNMVNIAVQSHQQTPSSPVSEDVAALNPVRGQLNVKRDERHGSDSPTEPSIFVRQEGSQVTASQPTLTPAEEGELPITPTATATIDEQSGAVEDGREQLGTQSVQVDMDEGIEFGSAKDEQGPEKDRETTEAETSTLSPPPPSPSSSTSGTMGKQIPRKMRRRQYNKANKKEKRRVQRAAERASVEAGLEDRESGSDSTNKDVAGDYVVDDDLAASSTPPAESASLSSVLTTPTTPREASLSPRLPITSSSQTPSPSAPSQPQSSHRVRAPIPLPRMHVHEGKGEAVDLRASTPEVQSTTGKGHQPEPNDHQPQRQAVDEVTPSPQEEISTRSDRGSLGSSSEPGPSNPSEHPLSGSTKPLDSTKPATVASQQHESKGTGKKKNRGCQSNRNRNGKGKGRAQLPETGSELDSSQQAPSPIDKTRQHDVQAQGAAVTDTSSLESHTSTEVASTSSTTPDVTESAVDSNRLRVLSITVPTAALAALDFNHPSDASAEDSSSDDEETPRPTPRLGVSFAWSSDEAQSTPSAPVTASQEWRTEPSPGATLTRPHSAGNTVDSAVGRTRGGASLRADLAAMPGPSTVVSPGSGAADASAATLSGFAATPTVTPGHGAQSSRQHAAMPAAPAGADAEHLSSSATPPSTTGSGTIETPTPIATPGNEGEYQRVEKPKNGGFWWDLTYHTFPCALASCTKRCHLWDGSTVICPRCGPYSQIRYCGKEHQREDLKWHWTYCGSPEYTFEHWCVPSSVPRDVAIGPPLLPCIWGCDSPGRFRQALFFNTGRREGDYFIFADWEEQNPGNHIPGSLDGRCSSRVALAVQFAGQDEKDRFRRCLAVCLLSSPEHPHLVDYLFRMIRDKLRSQRQWGAEMDVVLRQQMQFEMGIRLYQDVTGQRHACRTEWTGEPQSHCRNRTCAHENAVRHRQQPNVGRGGSFERLCQQMECTYWLLRANRTTHPTTSDVAARTRGEGYGNDVAPWDRREFRRGEGWDGAGTGPMEIDGPFLPRPLPAPV